MIYLASLEETIDDKLEGYSFIHTKNDLDKLVINNQVNNKVVIRQDFASKFFTPAGLVEYVENAKQMNCNLVIDCDEGINILTEERFISRLRRASTPDEYIYLMTKYPKEFVDTIHKCCGSMSKKNNEILASSNSVARLQNIIDDMDKKIEDLSYELETERINKLRVQSKLDALTSRIKYQFDINIDQSKLFRIDDNKFDKVIYFKEVSKVQYFDTFLYYLKEILRIKYNMPARLVVIEGYYADGRIPMYPDLVPHHQLRERDVLEGDILSLGFQPKLMGDILKNSSNVSILIVLDRGGYVAPHLTGKNVEYFFIASDPEDVSEKIPDARIISYTEKNLFIPYIDGFDEMDKSERLTKYSSIEIMSKIISLIERR